MTDTYTIVEWRHARDSEPHTGEPGAVHLRGAGENGADAINAECRTCGEVLLPRTFSVVTAHTTVETVEALEALPVGSVVRESNGHVWVKHPKVWHAAWPQTGVWHCDCAGTLTWTAREVLEESSEDGNTLTVLFRPDGGES